MKLSTLILAAGCALVAAAALAQERFDIKVRDDFFAGVAGDKDAMARAVKTCEDALKNDPGNAQALVWHGAALYFKSGEIFRAGDSKQGMELYQRGLKEMQSAATAAPDDIGVLIPRAAVLLTGSRFMPPEMAKPLIETGVHDYERTLELQSGYWSTLGSHPRGELLFGLAEGYSRLGASDQARVYFDRIGKELPGTVYAKRAATWLQTGSLPSSQTGCVGCHTGK